MSAAAQLARSFIRACLFALAVPALSFSADEAFGPVRFDVKERYGLENRYTEMFPATEGPHAILIRNGTSAAERPDVLAVQVNGEQVIGGEPLEHPLVIAVLHLRKQNVLDVGIRDHKPTGTRKPALRPKFIILSVVPLPGRFPGGLFGAANEKGFRSLMDALRDIGSRSGPAYALAAADLRRPVDERVRALRSLADERDASAAPFLTLFADDPWTQPEVRAEAVRGIGMTGDASVVPVLVSGLLDHEDTVRVASALALSSLPEDAAIAPVRDLLASLDPMRTAAFIRAMNEGAWKPVGALREAAGSDDPVIANKAVEVLGKVDDPRVPELLLEYLGSPGKRSMSVIISALGATRDRRAVERLLAIAMDQEKRTGNEAALGVALADLGEKRAVKPIRSMAKSVGSFEEFMALAEAYRRLTGEELKP